MRAHTLQHVPFEGLGTIESWLLGSGYGITTTKFFDSAVLPEVETIDFLVVMGGPMGVHDEKIHPWLAEEKTFIRSVIEAGKPVLGVCLGAQLIAACMGGEVVRNPVKEIGWFPVEAVPHGRDDLFRFPAWFQALHWHGDTFTLPRGAIQLARSQGCTNQAFQIGRQVIALQFHLEATPTSVQQLVSHCRSELVEGAFIAAEAEIVSATQRNWPEGRLLMASILDYLNPGAAPSIQS